MHVLGHRRLFVALPLVSNVAAADEDLAPCRLLQSLVIHTTGADDHAHERCLGELLDRDNDLLQELRGLPIHRRQVAFHVLDHVPDQAVVLRCHRLSNAHIPGVQPVARLVVDRGRRRGPDVRVEILEVVALDLSVQVLEPLLSQELVDLLLRETHRQVHVAEWLVRLVIRHAPALALLCHCALGPPGLALGTFFELFNALLVPDPGQDDRLRQVRGDQVIRIHAHHSGGGGQRATGRAGGWLGRARPPAQKHPSRWCA
mmetsp:Transcript_108927/g.243240  ORF Transcript_108927/g.243240 Transcript_108927/m.243240 type:complete len:259 (+) Transcript_108927:1326-2102(+)